MAIAAWAFDWSYSPKAPLTVERGLHLDSVPMPIDDLDVHLRVLVDDSDPWTIFVDYADSLNFKAVTLTCRKPEYAQSPSDREILASYRIAVNGVDSVVVQRVIVSETPKRGEYVSVVVKKIFDRYELSVGSNIIHEPLVDNLFADDAVPSTLVTGYDAPAGGRLIRHRVDYTPLPAPFVRTDLDSSEKLAAYLAESTDPIEGVYEYLDRDMNATLAIPGGFYSLALVQSLDNPGRYDILYYKGATTAAHLWSPGRRKGLLTPDVFIDSYSLSWLDAEGRPVNAECSATITQGFILDLSFPLLKSHLRFSRKPR